MTRGLTVGALERVTEKLLPAWDIDRHPAAFLAMTGRESGENVPPLEPDIVGEHFALSCLAQKKLTDADRARFCALAWRLNPLGMAQFMLRAHHDLPDDPMLPFVRKLPASEGELQLFWAWAAVDLMIDLRSRDPDAAEALLCEMRGVAVAADGYWERLEVKWPKSLLWELWARAAFDLTIDLSARDPDAARALLDHMRGVAEAHDEAALWEQWAEAAFNLMNDLRSEDPVAARALLVDMLRVAVNWEVAPCGSCGPRPAL